MNGREEEAEWLGWGESIASWNDWLTQMLGGIKCQRWDLWGPKDGTCLGLRVESREEGRLMCDLLGPQGARLPRWIETSFLAVCVGAVMVYGSGTAVARG